jgi:hypothetical protein
LLWRKASPRTLPCSVEPPRLCAGIGQTCLMPDERFHQKRAVSAARALLDEISFTAAWAAGWAMTLEQAVAYALEAVPAAINLVDSAA